MFKKILTISFLLTFSFAVNEIFTEKGFTLFGLFSFLMFLFLAFKTLFEAHVKENYNVAESFAVSVTTLIVVLAVVSSIFGIDFSISTSIALCGYYFRPHKFSLWLAIKSEILNKPYPKNKYEEHKFFQKEEFDVQNK